MKIGVNGRFLLKPYTGIGQYTLNLLKELVQLGGAEYIVVAPEKVDCGLEVGNALGAGTSLKVVVLPEKRLGTAGMRKTWWEQVTVPEFFRNAGVNVAWFPYPSNPWTRDFPFKTAVTVHDVIPWKFKEYRRGVLSGLYHGQSKKALKKADLILTVSKFSRGEIEKVCGVSGAEVVYNACSSVFDGRLDKEVLAKYGVKRGEYYLYVGGYDERKNVRYLLEEFKSEYPLVLAGGKAVDDDLYDSFDLDGEFVKTGFVEDKELASLYAGCKAFVNLSKYEGFGIPVLEAASCGAPLILSDIPVYREVAGEGATYVDLAKKGALQEVLSGPLVDSSEVARKFSWRESAAKIKKLFDALVA